MNLPRRGSLGTALQTHPMASERVVGWLLAAFILAQCFGLPLVSVGPWALWPTLADLTIWATLLAASLYSRPVQPHARGVWGALVMVVGLAGLAFLLLFMMGDGRLGTAVPFGLFQLFKLFQVMSVFWATSRLTLSGGLLALWEKAARLSFLVMVATIAWTYFSPAITDFFGEFMPRGQGVAGPWESYYRHNEHGLGTLGYNHAYVAAIVLLQGAFLMILRPERSHTWIHFAVVAACFLSGARAGLVGAVVFVFLESLRTPLRATLGVMLAGLAGAVAMPYLHADLAGLISRQATILEASDTSNLAGRSDIWQVYLNALLHDPFRMLLGSGMGSGTANMGANAHTLLLQVLYETGVVGLTVFGAFFGSVMLLLWQRRTLGARIALNVLIGLWVTSLAAETLYPNSAFGSFLPMLALVVVVALKEEERPRQLDLRE